MNNYLKGYLASIPKSEYDNMVSFLEDNIVDKLNISEEQFKILLEQIVSDKQPATSDRATLPNEKPSDTYNDFFGNVYIDLNYLFKVINLLYNAVDGYANLSASYLADIKGEVDRLEVMVRELQTRETYSSNATVVTETFKNTEYFEVYDNSTSYLFCDRNGNQLSTVDLVHNNTDDMIILNTTKDVDILHQRDGKPVGKVDVIDYRGIPVTTYAVTANAIDNSSLSYWDCTALSDEPIHIGMDGNSEGGAYIKFKVRLPAVYEVTEVSLTPYCVHPVELCSVMIGDTQILGASETSVDTITVRAAKAVSDEITFVLRQKNYIHTIATTNEKLDEATELWSRVTNSTKESYVSNEKITGEIEIYKHYVAEKEKEIAKWNIDLIKQREIGE